MKEKLMSKRFFSIVAAVLLVAALAIPVAVVSADTATATRTLPTTVDAGADFDVGIVASGCGQMGEVAETLPAGFSYVSTTSTDVIVTQVGNLVRFSFMGDGVTFDYTVTASTTEGPHTFSGVVKDDDLNEYTIGGDTSITVGADTPSATSATRTLPATAVDAGADFDVGIVASGCGQMGEVAETLPAGFSYVSTTSTNVFVTEEDSVVRFSFMGDGVSFDYTVQASTTEGPYTFSGVVKDDDLNEYTIGGDTSITVGPVGATSATRTLPATAVDAGADFDVGIVASGCGDMGEVEETLPVGFDYVSTTSTDVIVTEEDSVVRFSFIGDGVSFDYTVQASTTEGPHTFSGVVKDDDLNEYTIGGDTSITVGAVGPELVTFSFLGYCLDEGDTDTLVVIPAGATDLDIQLDATGDLDLELWDGATKAIGWKAEIDSKGSSTGTYEGDVFGYSGWDTFDEYITADGPLGQAYTVKVYGFKAGCYDVTGSYMTPGPDFDAPVITITAPDISLGSAVTVTASATDFSGVAWVYLEVSSSPEGIVAVVLSYDDEASITFVPGWSGTYTVEAWAADMVDNTTPDGTPKTATFEVD